MRVYEEGNCETGNSVNFSHFVTLSEYDIRPSPLGFVMV